MARDNVRYADVVFLMLCERVNDIDIGLRIQATELLGELGQARLETLWLSLDKQSKQEQDWCAAGAFVLALEDQFMAVRSAAIRSLCRLSLARPEFAAEAKTLLIDTFNDEAEEVRLLAVQSLHQICLRHQLDLDMAHLEAALCLLDDGQAEMRRTTRRLMAVARLPDEDALQRTVRCLHAAVQKYPDDLDEVFETLQSVGKQQSGLVARCTAQLLKLQRFYQPPVEPRPEDLYYVLKMVLILGACTTHPSLAAALPPYAYKHYMFFRLRCPRHVQSFRSTPWAPLFYRVNPSQD
jgi:integrator complex subunit 4